LKKRIRNGRRNPISQVERKIRGKKIKKGKRYAKSKRGPAQRFIKSIPQKRLVLGEKTQGNG